MTAASRISAGTPITLVPCVLFRLSVRPFPPRAAQLVLELCFLFRCTPPLPPPLSSSLPSILSFFFPSLPSSSLPLPSIFCFLPVWCCLRLIFTTLSSSFLFPFCYHSAVSRYHALDLWLTPKANCSRRLSTIRSKLHLSISSSLGDLPLW